MSAVEGIKSVPCVCVCVCVRLSLWARILTRRALRWRAINAQAFSLQDGFKCMRLDRSANYYVTSWAPIQCRNFC